jgi:hypothetical protein
MKRNAIAAGALAALGCALACGSGEEARDSLRPMGATQPAAGMTANGPPLIHTVILDPLAPTPGLPVRAQVDASDPDGDPLRIDYRWSRNGRPLDGAREAVLDTGELTRGDRLGLEVVASDGRFSSPPARTTAIVGNRGPLVQQVTLSPAEGVRPGDEVTALVAAADPDDDRLRIEYVWLVNGEEREGGERTFSTAGLARGDVVSVRVSGNDGDSESAPVTSPRLEIANSPPLIRGVPRPRNEDGTFHYQFEAEDPDGDHNLRFSLESAPDGMTIDPVLGAATFRPSASQVGTHPVEVVVKDPSGDASSLRFNVVVSETVTEAPPARRED